MNPRLAALALAAMIPAAFNPAPAAAAGSSIVVPLCDGTVGATVAIPLRPALPPARDGKGCCTKGCHTGSSRKRGHCHV